MAVDIFASTDGGPNFGAELEETERALREVTLMIEPSQGEVTKLSQRNAAITTHLQQMQNQLDRMSPGEVRSIYDSALDAQQRLLVMRGQLEKLQNEKQHLERYKSTLGQALNPSSAVAALPAGTAKSPFASVEMLVNAAQLTGMNGPSRRSLAACMARATNSFLLPVSPSISTVQSPAATSWIFR